MASTFNRKRLFAGMLLGGGILLILAGIVFAWANRQRSVTVTSTPASLEQVERASLAEAKTAFDAGTAVFLDVRDPGSYTTSHIPGAISIPLDELADRMDELDPTEWIIPYCT